MILYCGYKNYPAKDLSSVNDRNQSTATRTSRSIAIALLSAATLTLFAILILNGEQLRSVDLYVSDLLVTLRSRPLDYLMLTVTLAADRKVLLITDTAIVLLLLSGGFRREAAISALVFVSCSLSVKAIKWLVQRERPVAYLYDGVSAFSFPSGHSANVAATAIVLLWLTKSAASDRYRTTVVVGLITVVGLVGLSRIYLLAHWPSDVAAGFLLAVFVASVCGSLHSGVVSPDGPRHCWLSLSIWFAVTGAYVVWQIGDQLHRYRLIN